MLSVYNETHSRCSFFAVAGFLVLKIYDADDNIGGFFCSCLRHCRPVVSITWFISMCPAACTLRRSSHETLSCPCPGKIFSREPLLFSRSTLPDVVCQTKLLSMLALFHYCKIK